MPWQSLHQLKQTSQAIYQTNSYLAGNDHYCIYVHADFIKRRKKAYQEQRLLNKTNLMKPDSEPIQGSREQVLNTPHVNLKAEKF